MSSLLSKIRRNVIRKTIRYKIRRRMIILNEGIINRIIGKKIFFASTKQLMYWANEMCDYLPRDCDLVVAIPRAGLPVGGLIALRLGLPISTPELFSKGLIWEPRGARSKQLKTARNIKKILLVDDSMSSAKTMDEAEKFIHVYKPNAEIIKAVVTAKKYARPHCDFCHIILPSHDTVYEWQLTTAYIDGVAADLDGVICEECFVSRENEKAYINWIRNAKPLLIPKYHFKAIISNRLEKYRQETEDWLIKNNVKYKSLLLAKSISELGSHKSYWLMKIKPKFYIESDYETAKRLWSSTKIPVLCYKKMIMFS